MLNNFEERKSSSEYEEPGSFDDRRLGFSGKKDPFKATYFDDFDPEERLRLIPGKGVALGDFGGT